MKENNISIVGLNCCGCGNCFHVCSKNVISLQSNEEGFTYPIVGKTCVNCGKCLKFCPQLDRPVALEFQRGYVVLTKDVDIRKRASSGGVFGTIAKNILSDKAHVCAAIYRDDVVKHIITDQLEDIKSCQGSKYVQSELNESFINIRDLLRAGKKVLFCGTPCQVAALYSYLQDRPQNLYTLDLVCHGVPSPMFLKKDLQSYHKKIKNIKFRWRNPKQSRTKSKYFLTIVKKNSRTLCYSSGYDPYFASFMKGESFRYSCYNCLYANLNRVGDITIGDCDSGKLYPRFHPQESKSIVLVNNQHGLKLWNDFSKYFDYIDLDIKKEAEINHQLSHPFVKPLARQHIYKDVKELTIKQLRAKYAKPSTRQQKLLFALQSYSPLLYKWLIQQIVK